jgi:hypothetical protein
MVGFWKHGDDPSGYKRSSEFLVHLDNHEIFKVRFVSLVKKKTLHVLLRFRLEMPRGRKELGNWGTDVTGRVP